MTIDQALRHGQARLHYISDAPHLDTQWLVLHVLEQGDTSWLYAHSDTVLSLTQASKFLELLDIRATGKPLAYLLDSWEFYGRRFLVDERVLVPRPSTELLVHGALQRIHRLHSSLRRPLILADVGTGSGCIAITLLLETLPTIVTHIFATDISHDALAVAQCNAALYGVQDRIIFLEGDMLTPLRDRPIDLIVSNPPYVSTEALTKAGCFPETAGLMFEPRVALDGGHDGQHFMRCFQASGLPALIEGIGGSLFMFTTKKKSPRNSALGEELASIIKPQVS